MKSSLADVMPSGLTNEEIAAGLRDVCGEFARRGVLVVCMNDPRLTQSQRDRAARLIQELYPREIK